MKKIILILSIMSFTTQAIPTCEQAYFKAEQRRIKRDFALTVAPGVAAVGALTLGGAIVPFGSIMMGSMLATMPRLDQLDSIREDGKVYAANTFRKMIQTYDSAKLLETNSTLLKYQRKRISKLVSRVLRKADADYSEAMEDTILQMFVDGFENQTFCPLVSKDQFGEETRNPFSLKKVISMIAKDI